MWIVLLLSFLTGFAVMQVELVAPRLVAPLLGSTQLTWSAVFAVFLAALALGNAVGGVLADRGGRRTVAGMFFAALVLVAAIVPAARWLEGGALDGLGHGVRTIVVVLVLFGPAAFALGLIGPALARAALARSSRSGRALGAVASAGAVGSMAGTLGTGLWLMGSFDLHTIVFAGGALAALGGVLALGLPLNRLRSTTDGGRSTPLRWMALAALAGASLLIVEVVAGRLAARRLGTSLYTWTSVIATVLLGLAIGNAWGGRLAERADRTRTLSVSFAFASVAVAACLWTPRLIAYVAVPSSGSWPLLVVLACAVAFLLPAVALGTLGPVILRAALADPASDGRVAGRIYAAGTLGAVVGSLLAGYVLLPALGAPLLFVVVALALAFAPLCMRKGVEIPLLVTLLGLGFVIAAPMEGVADLGRKLRLRPDEDIHVVESRYFHIEVEPHTRRWVRVPEFDRLRQRLPLPDFEGRLSFDERRGHLHWRGPMRPEERDRIATLLGTANRSAAMTLFDRAQTNMLRLTLDGFVHGYVDLDDREWLEYDYEVLYAALVRALRPTQARLQCFFIGGGCYTFQHHLLRHRGPNVVIETAELDPAVTQVAHDVLGLPRDRRHTIHHDDARTVLRGSDTKYDLIFGDAFHDLAVPWHLTTREFTESVQAHLKSDGVYLINLIDVYSSGRFLRAFLDTLDGVFPFVRVLSMAPRDDDRQETFLVVASGAALRWNRLTDANGRALSIIEYDEADREALRSRTQPRVLRDTFAPVEHLLAPVVRQRGSIDRSR